jgi:type I restriction enzyme S subunit
MNVHFAGFKTDGLAFLDDEEAQKLDHVIVQAGDVLLNITGASIGRVTTAPQSMAGARVNQHVCIVRPKPELSTRFLAQFLASPQQQAKVGNVQVGVTRQALTKAMIGNWEVPVPPIEEQRQIVAEIEKQFTRLEAGVAGLRRVQANLKRYRAAVLKAACEGKLADAEVGNRGAEIPPGWRQVALGDIVESMKNGIYRPRNVYADDGIACLRMYNIEAGNCLERRQTDEAFGRRDQGVSTFARRSSG